MGFTKGIQDWRKYLQRGGLLVVSEITWLVSDVPKSLRNHWKNEYPEIATASQKIHLLEENGYTPTAYFTLSPDCWLDEYYKPLESQFSEFLKRQNYSTSAKSIV